MHRAILMTMACVVMPFAAAGMANASIVLTIDNYTADELSFSISGTFNADTIGQSPGYLALKNDWSNNQGIHTEMFSVLPSVTLNTILIGGVAPTTVVQNGSNTWMDNVFFGNPNGTETPILAGTSVSGSMTLSAIGAFNPANIGTLELVSGFVRPEGHDDWARFEARAQDTAATPEPASIAIWGGIGIAGLVVGWRRRAMASKATAA